jgi:hypothetical protein
MGVCYLTPKARLASNGTRGRDGHCSIANEPIAAGETIAAFGGRCIARAELELLSTSQQRRSIQIDDTLFLAGALEPEPADFVNHSCEPNCGMSGSVLVVALRDIAAGEELTYDFAMSDGSDYDEFECTCGSALCRGKVTGHDWMLPELQLRYRGHFSPYLGRRIADLVSIGAERRVFAL